MLPNIQMVRRNEFRIKPASGRTVQEQDSVQLIQSEVVPEAFKLTRTWRSYTLPQFRGGRVVEVFRVWVQYVATMVNRALYVGTNVSSEDSHLRFKTKKKKRLALLIYAGNNIAHTLRMLYDKMCKQLAITKSSVNHSKYAKLKWTSPFFFFYSEKRYPCQIF